MMERNVASADALRRLCGTVMKTARQELMQHLSEAGSDLSPHQFLALMNVSGHTLTLGELSRAMGLDPSTLAPTVEVLVRKGLVQRDRDPQDRRRTLLSVTEAGGALLAQVTRQDEQGPLLSGLQALGEEKSHQLISLLEELVTAIHPTSEAEHAHPCQLPMHKGR
ncbi:MarR family winged helix-turn-helix transcriptional regulator [Dictyobacter aurantiacus]|uniref:HTH marR-type domain-containing protein n=1 Tax=Dictyobacter aurantiacus TaxID=1936993 RepID=A0A401ZJV6_9CHLR|nr:MarR family winged helix-turn-helix transcriptional regulator [Dictyobacter aurantiacus]GCE07110.1 hypothetical protein KDAU_44390 [Dictyobacter aurantiacus]